MFTPPYATPINMAGYRVTLSSTQSSFFLLGRYFLFYFFAS